MLATVDHNLIQGKFRLDILSQAIADIDVFTKVSIIVTCLIFTIVGNRPCDVGN